MTVFYQTVPLSVGEAPEWKELKLPCKPETLLKHLNKSVDMIAHPRDRSGWIGTIQVASVWFIQLGKIWVPASRGWLEMSKEEEWELFIKTVSTMRFSL